MESSSPDIFKVPIEHISPDSKIFRRWNYLNGLFPQINTIMGLGLGIELIEQFGVEKIFGEYRLDEKGLMKLEESMTAVHAAYNMPKKIAEKVGKKRTINRLFDYNVKKMKEVLKKLLNQLDIFCKNEDEIIETVKTFYKVAGNIIDKDDKLRSLGRKLKKEITSQFSYINNFISSRNLQGVDYEEIQSFVVR